MSRRKPAQLKGLKSIENDRTYTTGEARGLLKAIGLPHSKPWFYDRLEDTPAIARLFSRPNPTGHRYIKGSDLKKLVRWLRGGQS